MVVVSTRDFRTNQTKYLNLAKAGEHVVLWFFFFSMIKRMLQPSKSMLSSNLYETWDLILNRIYKLAL